MTTTTVSRRLSATDAVRAVRLSGRLEAHDRWSPEQLRDHRASALRDASAAAALRSPVYRERLGADGLVAPVTKTELMARWPEWVAEPALADLGALREHVAGVHEDALLDGRFRAMTTSGSSRSPGMFVFDRAEWVHVLALALRNTRWAGLRPSLPRPRVAYVVSPPGPHMAARLALTLDTLPVFRRRTTDAMRPLPEIVAELQRLQPDTLITYASILGMLAVEQLEGRLQIAPERVISSSEPLTPETAELARRAWGSPPSDFYATTETGPMGTTCDHGRMHVFEDLAVLEVVDDELRPVPDGETGTRILLTNLYARTQPIVRFEVSDVMRIAADPCPCGRPWRTIEEIGGRTDDVLMLPSASAAGQVAVHPIAFGVLGQVPGVREFEVELRDDALVLRVAADGDTAALAARDAVAGRLAELGAVAPALRVEVVADMREQRARTMGKLKLVRDERGTADHAAAGAG